LYHLVALHLVWPLILYPLTPLLPLDPLDQLLA